MGGGRGGALVMSRAGENVGVLVMGQGVYTGALLSWHHKSRCTRSNGGGGGQ